VVCANAAMAIATVTNCSPLEGSRRKESLLSEKDFYLEENLQELQIN
jgi:anthranilate phosphoribosyltransferase